MIVTRSETSDDAVKLFEASMEKLRRLDIATGYMEVFKEVDNLKRVTQTTKYDLPNCSPLHRSEARMKRSSDSRSALPLYTRLHGLVAALKAAQPAAEGAAPHLIHHVESQADLLFKDLRNVFGEALEGTLEAMGWPGKDLNLNGKLISSWTDQVETLLDLQEP